LGIPWLLISAALVGGTLTGYGPPSGRRGEELKRFDIERQTGHFCWQPK
jgi:hypothetical protein